MPATRQLQAIEGHRENDPTHKKLACPRTILSRTMRGDDGLGQDQLRDQRTVVPFFFRGPLAHMGVNGRPNENSSRSGLHPSATPRYP